METIQYFLSKLVIFVLIIGGIILIFIGLQKFAPEFAKKFSFTGGSGTFFTDNWLPDPVNLQEMSKPKTADLSNQVFEGGLTPGTSYVIYTDKGMEIIKVPEKNKIISGEAIPVIQNSSAIRNLSIYREGNLSRGMVFYGEAKSTFFYNGTFPIYLFDSQSRTFGKELAISTGQWSTPGWTRFYVKINANLPPHQSCLMLFVPDPNSQDRNINYRAGLPVVCN